jgi:hypothetical protein
MGGFDTGGGAANGLAGASSFSASAATSRDANLGYANPWVDLAGMDLPKSVKSLFRRVANHVVLNPLISSAVRKLSAYPVTEVIVEAAEDPGFDQNVQRWEDLLHRVLNIQSVQVELGIDYYTYGNAFASVYLPFIKVLTCASCKKITRLGSLKFGHEWNFNNFQYTMVCPGCGYSGVAQAADKPIHSAKDIRIVRWEPEYVDIDYNPVTTHARYHYTLPPDIAAKIRQKDPWYLTDMPVAFIESVRLGQRVTLLDVNLFHFRAPSPSTPSARGWGLPPILAAMKDSYHLQIMKKANEAVMLEHLLPLDIFYPTAGNGQQDPYLHVNLASWQRDVERQISLWRRDPNHKPVMSVPIGTTRIGGTGKSLMLHNEIRAASEHILVGMNVPQEFVFGGLTWTGSSVSIRMLENMFIADRAMHERFLRHFVVPIVSMFMRWSPVNLRMRTFRMADDVQAKQLLIQLRTMQEISSKTLLAEFGKDADEEQKLMNVELRQRLETQKVQLIAQVDAQAEANERQQARMAAAAQPAGPQVEQEGNQPQKVNVVELAQAYAQKLSQMDPAARQKTLQEMQARSPQLAALVRNYLAGSVAQGQQPQAVGGGAGRPVVDMRPMPEQRPPRRAGAA